MLLRRQSSILCALAASSVVAACSNDGTNPQPKTPADIRLVSGNGQAGTVGQALAAPLIVRVTASDGSGLADATVEWTVEAGGGNISRQSASTDDDGEASVTWTVGEAAGTNNNTVTATVEGLSGPKVTFRASAAAGAAAGIAVRDGDGQTAPASSILPVHHSVRVTDQFDNSISGVTVSWSAASGGGSVSAATSVSDGAGIATIERTLGPGSGPQTTTATVAGLTGSPVTFVAAAIVSARVMGAVTVASGILVAAHVRAGPGVGRDNAPVRRSLAHKGGRDGGGMTPGLAPAVAPASRPPALQRNTADDLIVTFRSAALAAPPTGTAAMSQASTATAVGAAIRSRLSAGVLSGAATLAGVSPALLAARVKVADLARIGEVEAELRRNPAIASVERNGIAYSHEIHAPPTALVGVAASLLEPYQAWHYAMIDLPAAWELTRGSTSVLVAVVDDGIRFDHPGISVNLTGDGYDFVSDVQMPLCSGATISNAGDGGGYDPDPTVPARYNIDPAHGCAVVTRYSGHGLHVAGTIGATDHDAIRGAGVSPTVRIRPVRVLGVTGNGSYYDIAQGILYAAGLPADNGIGGFVQAPSGARIINLSLGGATPSTILESSMTAASNAGALIVVSAGNTGTSAPSYPAAYSTALSVSAVGPDRLLSTYSSFGPNVAIGAPGGDFDDGDGTFGVWSTIWDFQDHVPLIGGFEGTSMAAPHVAGVAALLLARTPSLTAAQLRTRLTSFAVDAGQPGPDQSYGAGILNARNSLTQSFEPARASFVRLYNATTGELVQRTGAQVDGSFAFPGLQDGSYHVYAGQDADGDGVIGLPGRRWGAFGGVGGPTAITVQGEGDYPASFSIALPGEREPNNTTAESAPLYPGGYLMATLPDADVDMARVAIHQPGQYTFETSGWRGACGFAIEVDTVLDLLDASGGVIASNDDIDTPGENYCSRITTTLTPGTYYLQVRGYPGSPVGGRYRLEARAGP
ncbi:MAG: DVUA0089 family protein [Gemmatimonadota bacterium]|nr:DVUA0089 family protein [Gemmatimonadota bacterium]